MNLDGYHAIYISGKAARVIGAFSNGQELSERINCIVELYGNITLESCPALAENEWHCLCEAFRNAIHNIDYGPNDLILCLFDDYKGLGQKMEIDVVVLARRLKNMSYVQQCSVVEVVRRYLQIHESCSCENIELLESCGAKII